jgi:hypothetical protein
MKTAIKISICLFIAAVYFANLVALMPGFIPESKPIAGESRK